MKRVKCPRCGAMKEGTAETKCRPIQDHSGEYECPMDYYQTDDEGWFIAPVPAGKRGKP